VPGTDGSKMSKSYNNFIDVFLPEKELLKQVKTIITDSTPLEEPKNPDTCNVYKLYELVGTTEQTQNLRSKYLAGNFGYGHAKQALFELLMERFKKEREQFTYLMQHQDVLESELQKGEARAREYAQMVLERVRSKTGFN
jgi:tryptophanyl-tRNA synthetase